MEKDKMEVASRRHGNDEESYKILPENPKGRDHLEELGIPSRITLK
jgi:hypothetical protein